MVMLHHLEYLSISVRHTEVGNLCPLGKLL
jgi:hypothetical protein